MPLTSVVPECAQRANGVQGVGSGTQSRFISCLVLH